MALSLQSLDQNYQSTLKRISDYAHRYDRAMGDIRLIAVSKRHAAQQIIDLIRLGHRDFGENYLQEAADKIAEVAGYFQQSTQDPEMEWHFIGHIQSRKCRDIAQLFHWVHTVESVKVANRLNQHREGMDPLQVMIQLNLQEEESKSGIAESELPVLATHIQSLPNLKLRGLMIIPKPESDFDKQRTVFSRCREAQENLNRQGFHLDQLSMGMTDDMEAAIAEGATQIRIGTAIFGPRPD